MVCAIACATSHTSALSRGLPWVGCPLSRLPPLGLLPGHSPAQEARCLCEGNALMSAPSAPLTATAAVWATPGIVWARATAAVKGAT